MGVEEFLPKHVERMLRKLELPIRINEIQNAKEWLFLNGYKDPILSHRAFDFSAYETFDGKRSLGIPATSVYAPFSGFILRAQDGYYGADEPGYYGEVELLGKVENCIVTATFAHIVPSVGVGLGEIEKGAIIGRTFESPRKDSGTLDHLHLQLEAVHRGQKYGVNPIRVFFDKQTQLKRVYLPHFGPFTKEELLSSGLEIKFSSALNYYQKPSLQQSSMNISN